MGKFMDDYRANKVKMDKRTKSVETFCYGVVKVCGAVVLLCFSIMILTQVL